MLYSNGSGGCSVSGMGKVCVGVGVGFRIEVAVAVGEGVPVKVVAVTETGLALWVAEAGAVEVGFEVGVKEPMGTGVSVVSKV